MKFRKRDIRVDTEAYEHENAQKGERIVFAYVEEQLVPRVMVVIRTDGVAGYFNDRRKHYGIDAMLEEGERQIEELWEALKQTGMT